MTSADVCTLSAMLGIEGKKAAEARAEEKTQVYDERRSKREDWKKRKELDSRAKIAEMDIVATMRAFLRAARGVEGEKRVSLAVEGRKRRKGGGRLSFAFPSFPLYPIPCSSISLIKIEDLHSREKRVNGSTSTASELDSISVGVRGELSRSLSTTSFLGAGGEGSSSRTVALELVLVDIGREATAINDGPRRQ